MEISPRELRDIEIREAFRGYNRDDVNDLLERAALTIDALTERVRELGDRLSTTAPGAVGAQARARDLEDMLERTLLLAKRAADEEVTEAQTKARQLVGDAEAKARKLLLDAEIDARRRAEQETGKIQRELVDFGERRDVLVAAVTELERFESEYRERLLRSIEADLAVISGRSPAAPGPRPDVPDVEIPPLPEAVHRRDADEPRPAAIADAPAPAIATSATADDASDGFETIATADTSPNGGSAREPSAMSAMSAMSATPGTPATSGTPASTDEPTAAYDARLGDLSEPDEQIDLLDAEDRDERDDRDTLDTLGELDADDAFFAQLRDAVSDDQPLTEGEGSFFDQDTHDAASREIFRRRR
jgi:cell division initiation protein